MAAVPDAHPPKPAAKAGESPAASAAPSARPVVLSYRPSMPRSTRMSRLRQKVRDFMRPDHLREFGSTLALVAPLTVLIWVWAEREQAVQVPDKRPFIVEVRAVNPSTAVSLASGQTSTVIIEMTGPRAGVEGIKDAIARDASKGRLTVDVSDALPPGGPYPIVLDALLDQQKLFKDYGVTVQGTEPSSLQVVVDRQVERDVPVTLPPEIQDGVQSAITDPKTVKVRGPEQLIKQLEATGKLKADLDIANLGDARSRGSPKVDLSNVPLRRIEGAAGVVFESASIDKVSLQLSQKEKGEIKSMVVFVNKAAGLEGHVIATITPLTLTGVQVIGPSDVIRQLREERLPAGPPYAVITITRDDIGTHGGHRVPTVMNLPPGVDVVQGSVSDISFDVSESTASDDARPIP